MKALLTLLLLPAIASGASMAKTDTLPANSVNTEENTSYTSTVEALRAQNAYEAGERRVVARQDPYAADDATSTGVKRIRPRSDVSADSATNAENTDNAHFSNPNEGINQHTRMARRNPRSRFRNNAGVSESSTQNLNNTTSDAATQNNSGLGTLTNQNNGLGRNDAGLDSRNNSGVTNTNTNKRNNIGLDSRNNSNLSNADNNNAFGIRNNSNANGLGIGNNNSETRRQGAGANRGRSNVSMYSETADAIGQLNGEFSRMFEIADQLEAARRERLAMRLEFEALREEYIARLREVIREGISSKNAQTDNSLILVGDETTHDSLNNTTRNTSNNSSTRNNLDTANNSATRNSFDNTNNSARGYYENRNNSNARNNLDNRNNSGMRNASSNNSRGNTIRTDSFDNNTAHDSFYNAGRTDSRANTGIQNSRTSTNRNDYRTDMGVRDSRANETINDSAKMTASRYQENRNSPNMLANRSGHSNRTNLRIANPDKAVNNSAYYMSYPQNDGFYMQGSGMMQGRGYNSSIYGNEHNDSNAYSGLFNNNTNANGYYNANAYGNGYNNNTNGSGSHNTNSYGNGYYNANAYGNGYLNTNDYNNTTAYNGMQNRNQFYGNYGQLGNNGGLYGNHNDIYSYYYNNGVGNSPNSDRGYNSMHSYNNLMRDNNYGTGLFSHANSLESYDFDNYSGNNEVFGSLNGINAAYTRDNYYNNYGTNGNSSTANRYSTGRGYNYGNDSGFVANNFGANSFMGQKNRTQRPDTSNFPTFGHGYNSNPQITRG